MNCYPPYLSNVEDASVAFCQPLKDYYFDLFKFAVSVNLKKLNLVCNLNGETGLSTFCADGKQIKCLMVIHHLSNNRKSLGRHQPDPSSKMAAGTDEENIFHRDTSVASFELPFKAFRLYISEISQSVERKLSYHLHLWNFEVNGKQLKFSSVGKEERSTTTDLQNMFVRIMRIDKNFDVNKWLDK